jgi:hypothetical protein
MPYIVTTKRPEDGEFLNPVNGQSQPYGPTESLSRRAVGTLEGREVWNALYGVNVPNREDVVEQIAALPGSGGTVTLAATRPTRAGQPARTTT